MEKNNYVDTLNQRAWQLIRQDPTHANVLATEAYQIAQRADYDIGEADALTIRSHVYLEEQTYDEAIVTAHEAIRLYELRPDIPMLSKYPYAVAALAESYMHLGDLEVALFWLERQLDAAEMINDAHARASALQNISTIYGNMNDYVTALRYLYDATEIASETQQPRLYQLGAQHALALKDYDSAIDNATIALRLYEEHQSSSGQSIAHSTLGDIYLAMGNVDKARSHYDIAWQFSRNTSRPLATLRSLLQLGKLALHEAQWEAAREHYLGALAFSQRTENHQVIVECHKALADIFEQLEDFKEALFHAKRYALLRDDLLTAEANLRIQRLDMLQRTRIAQRDSEFYAERARQLQALRERDVQYFEELSVLKDEMMRTASHDLKSPLATIRTLVYLLRTDPNEERAKELLERIDHQVDRMTDLIANVLDLAKIETGRAINVELQSIRQVIAPAIEEMIPLAEAQQITLVDEIQDANAHLDALRIRQVIDNLLSNAIKYSEPNATITVRSSKLPSAVMIEIIDQGMGIPPDDIPHIFDRFYRVDAVTHRNREGTGLGLAIAKSIIEQHGGEISVESVVGQGSTFRFTMPAP